MTQKTIAQVKAALRKNAGVLVLAAQDLGLSRQALHMRLHNNPDLQTFKDQIEAELIDAAEAVVANAILAKDKQMTRWYLDRKGRERGYTTRTELTGPGGAAIAVAQRLDVTVTYVDAPASEPEEEPPI